MGNLAPTTPQRLMWVHRDGPTKVMPERKVREAAAQMPANGEGYLPGKGKNMFTHRTLEQDSILKKAQRQGMPQTRP